MVLLIMTPLNSIITEQIERYGRKAQFVRHQSWCRIWKRKLPIQLSTKLVVLKSGRQTFREDYSKIKNSVQFSLTLKFSAVAFSTQSPLSWIVFHRTCLLNVQCFFPALIFSQILRFFFGNLSTYSTKFRSIFLSLFPFCRKKLFY